MSQFWSQHLHSLSPYVPGEQPQQRNLIKLNTNENPYGPSPKVLAAIQAATNDQLRLYPDPDSTALKNAVAHYYGITAEQVFLGNGSDEILAHCFYGLLKQSEPLLFPAISYSFYPVYCGLYAIDYRTVPLAEDFRIAVADYQQPNGGVIIPNPNAPTGQLLALDQIAQLAAQNSRRVVVIDEAYIDFGGASAVSLIDTHPNLLVIQTLSKARSLAGLRVGFAMGNPALITGLERVKNSFNSYPLDSLAVAGAVAAMEDRDYYEQTRQQVMATRERLQGLLAALGFHTLPSAANFVLTEHPQVAATDLAQGLRERGIIVRHFKQPEIDNYLRISIGTDDEIDTLVTALRQLV